MWSKKEWEKLDQLFESLKATRNVQESRPFEQQIWRIWMKSIQPEINELMDLGCNATGIGNYTEAIEIFSDMIEKYPGHHEGWNKRATVYYLRGDFKHSLLDIQHTLQLEKRHFGALSGMISIYDTLDFYPGLQQCFELLSEIYPLRDDFRQRIAQLKKINAENKS